MADEKKIKVSVIGDASGLNKEIERSSNEMRKSFKDAGLSDILDDAEKRFSSIRDKMKAVTEAMRQKQVQTRDEFGERLSYAKDKDEYNRIDKEAEKVGNKQNEAMDKWLRVANLLEEALKRGTVDESGNPINPETPPSQQEAKPTAKQKASLMSRMISRTMNGDVGGAAMEGVTGEGGLAVGLGASAGTIAVIAAMGVAVVKAIRMGYEGVKLDNKLSARKDFDFDKYTKDNGEEASKLGLSINEFKEFTLEQMQSMKTYNMSQTQTTNEIIGRVALKRGYGLNDNEISGFDQFKQQDTKGANATQIIADILSRSEKTGILGVSGADFSLLPQKLETVNFLLSQQKSDNVKIDSSSSIALMMAGQAIGGRFADDRANEPFAALNNAIKSPTSPGMKAFMFQALQRAHPNESYTRILARQEGGANAENLRDIMPYFDKLPKGEYRTMIAKQIFGRWQDAVQIDENGGFDKILKSQINKDSESKGLNVNKQIEVAKERGEKFTTKFESAMSSLETLITEKVGRPLVELVGNTMNDGLKVMTATPGGWITSKPVPNKVIKPNNH